MAKKKKKKSKGMFGGFKLHFAALAGSAVGPANILAEHKRNGGDIAETAGYSSSIYTGYDTATKSFALSNMADGLLPMVIGAAVSGIVGQKMGVNRILGRAKIPVLRL